MNSLPNCANKEWKVRRRWSFRISKGMDASASSGRMSQNPRKNQLDRSRVSTSFSDESDQSRNSRDPFPGYRKLWRFRSWPWVMSDPANQAKRCYLSDGKLVLLGSLFCILRRHDSDIDEDRAEGSGPGLRGTHPDICDRCSSCHLYSF